MAAPKGNRNAIKGKIWSAAIDRALAKRSKATGIKAIDELAEKLLTLCDQGELSALKELGDRMEGRPAQSMTLAGDDDHPLTTKVVREVIHTKNTDS